jgi:branched-chain amino acid transport system substrate-binding protein
MAKKKTVKLGFSSAFDSPYGVVTANQFKGVELAVHQINEEGGVYGMPVEIISFDDKMDVKLAEKGARELVRKHKVDMLSGSLSAATQINTNNVAKEFGLPFMSMSQSNILTTSQYCGPHTFHEALTPHMSAQLIARWGLEHLGRRWMFVIADYIWGWEMYESFKIALRRMGGVDLGVIKVPLGAKVGEYEQHFPRILKEKPDVLGVVNLGADQIKFVRAAHKLNLKKEMSVVLSIAELTITEQVSIDELVGMYWGVNFYWGLEDTIPTANNFVDAFRNRFEGELPTGYSGYSYSGTKELLIAARESGEYPLDADKITAFLEGRSFDHYKGRQWWRPCDHQSFQDFYIMKFKGPEESEGKYDIGEVLGTVSWDLDVERDCQTLGHKDHLWGHLKPQISSKQTEALTAP